MTNTRSSHRWPHLPGNFDTNNTRWLYDSDNDWEIPALPKATRDLIPKAIVPYKTRVRDEEARAQMGLHFFLDDYHFETLYTLEEMWRRPIKVRDGLEGWKVVFTPDFSLYSDWPFPIQLRNVYRNRWCGAHWNAYGLKVIPTVAWSDEKSFIYCFEGLPKDSVLAVSSVGVRSAEAKHYFRLGFEEMVGRLSPAVVLCYGKCDDELHRLVEIVEYPTRWDGLREARKALVA